MAFAPHEFALNVEDNVVILAEQTNEKRLGIEYFRLVVSDYKRDEPAIPDVISVADRDAEPDPKLINSQLMYLRLYRVPRIPMPIVRFPPRLRSLRDASLWRYQGLEA